MEFKDMNNFKSYQIETIKRENIKLSYYNPRKISEEAKRKLKKQIKENGLVMPLVWNKQTGNLCAGHQRIQILDELNKTQDYDLEIAVIDVPLEKEVKLNVFLNNTSAMGEMDKDLLQDISFEFPEIDFIEDFGFDKLDLKYMDIEEKQEIKTEFEIESDLKVKNDLQAIKENNIKDKKIKAIENGDSHQGEQNDYILTIVFNTNKDKWDFNKRIGLDVKEKYIKYSKIYDITKDEFKI